MLPKIALNLWNKEKKDVENEVKKTQHETKDMDSKDSKWNVMKRFILLSKILKYQSNRQNKVRKILRKLNCYCSGWHLAVARSFIINSRSEKTTRFTFSTNILHFTICSIDSSCRS